MVARDKALQSLRMLRYGASLAMLGVVVAGAFGYGEAVQLSAAGVGIVGALALKVTHIIV